MTSPPSPLAAPCFRQVREGVELDVLVQPRASRSRVVGLHDGRLKVQLAAPPVDGAANEALVDLFAELLGLPARLVVLLRGDASRRKTVRFDGQTLASVSAHLLPEAS
jgi:hypothetical protein